jgi:hypothetical protein
MIGAGASFWGGSVNYLAGNAKVYDGSFDYDQVASWSQLTYTSSFSILIALDIERIPIGTPEQIFQQGGSGGNDPSLLIGLQNNNIRFIMREISTKQLTALTPITLGKKVIIVVFDASLPNNNTNKLRIFIEGAEPAKTYTNTSPFNIVNGVIDYARIGRTTPPSSTYFDGQIRQLEIINRVATPAEIAAASATGSFRGAGIAHNSGQYLLAVDFDKMGTVPPTTFAGTPAYSITSFGGAAYTPYL